MTIAQTVEIPIDYRIYLELPHSVPTGVQAQIKIEIPSTVEQQNNVAAGTSLKTFRGILKGKGITTLRLREMQREDKALEDEAEMRQRHGTR